MKTRTKIALAGLAQAAVMGLRRLGGLGTEAVVTRRGLRWQLDLREGIDFSIYLLGAFEPLTVAAYQRLIRPGDTILDIGANIGAHTLHLARAVGATGIVAAFEPTAFAFAKLKANIALNPDLAPRIDARQVMLLDRAGAPAAEVYSSWPLTGAKEVHALHMGELKSTTGAVAVTLDQAVDEIGLARVDLIKLDVDGFECAVLRGAAHTIKRFRPPLVMEIAPHVLTEHGESLDALVALLAGYGYRLGDLSMGASIRLDAAHLNSLVPSGASLNVLARLP